MSFTTTTTTNTTNTTQLIMTRSSYAPSTYSESTTYSVDAVKMDYSTSPSSPKQSLRTRVKSFLSSIGEDPTAAYDREHGLQTKRLYYPVPPPSRL